MSTRSAPSSMASGGPPASLHVATPNGTLLRIVQDVLPFGGIGPSGTGALIMATTVFYA